MALRETTELSSGLYRGVRSYTGILNGKVSRLSAPRFSPILTARRRPRSAGRGRSGGFVKLGRRAEVVEDAFRAQGFAGLAYPAAVEDEQVRKERSLALGDYPEEIPLYLLRIFLLGETEPARDAPDVGVHDDALVHTEGVAQDHVRRLATDAGEGDELGHGAGDLPAVPLEQVARHPLQGAGLVAVEARGADVFLQPGDIGAGVVGGGTVPLEELFGDHVHPHIGGLGGEHGRDQELQRVLPDKLSRGVGVLPFQAGDYLGDRGGV